MTTRPVTFPGRSVPLRRQPRRGRRARRRRSSSTRGTAPSRRWLLVALAVVALLVGVLFVLPVGGADVPIVISLLNAFTGLTVAASGYVLDNVLLLVAGTLVGASGTILTRLMAAAMGRSLPSTLFGAFRAGTAVAAGPGEDRPVRSGSARGRRHPARLRPQGRHRARATGSRSRRPSTPSASWPSCSRRVASRCSTASTPSPAGCRGT